jgi:uncharacterized protein
MEVNVSQQLKSPIGTVREYDVNEMSDILGTGVRTLIEGKVKFTKTHRGILVQGTLRGIIPVECSRCLKTFGHPLNIEIEEEFFPLLDVTSGASKSRTNPVLTIDEHHI